MRRPLQDAVLNVCMHACVQTHVPGDMSVARVLAAPCCCAAVCLQNSHVRAHMHTMHTASPHLLEQHFEGKLWVGRHALRPAAPHPAFAGRLLAAVAVARLAAPCVPTAAAAATAAAVRAAAAEAACAAARQGLWRVLPALAAAPAGRCWRWLAGLLQAQLWWLLLLLLVWLLLLLV
jgi:hypothetical protein